MKAIVVRQFGGPEVLRLEDVPAPQMATGEVLVRVHAAGVNLVDTEARAGRGHPLELPAILGWELSGVIEAVGSGAARFRVGDHVYGMPRFPEPAGACAEFAVAPERSLAFKPMNLTHPQAASLPLAALTAQQALEAMGLRAGQTILVHAAGGVGELAAQLSKILGARVIGADFPGDPSEFLERRLEPVDAVLDTVGGAIQGRWLARVKPGGWFVSTAETMPGAIRVQRPELQTQFLVVQPSGSHLEQIAGLVESSQLKPGAISVFPFETAAQAHALLEAGRIDTSFVLEVRSQSP